MFFLRTYHAVAAVDSVSTAIGVIFVSNSASSSQWLVILYFDIHYVK